jgi:hypothetical protein
LVESVYLVVVVVVVGVDVLREREGLIEVSLVV